MFPILRQPNSKLSTIAVLAAFLCVSGCGGTPQQRAKNYYEKGAKLLAQKDYPKATIEFKNAIQLNASLVDAWRGLAEIEEESRRLPEHTAILRKIVELAPKDFTVRVKLARNMLLANNPDEALKSVNAALALKSDDAEALIIKAAALLRTNDAPGAIANAQRALELDPGSAGALMVLAAEKASRGDNQGALEVLERITAGEGNFGVQFFKIQLFEKMGDFKQVETLIRKLTEVYPKEPLFHRQLAKLYLNQKRIDDAEKEVRAIAAINPEDINAALDVVRFLNTTRGREAAKQELLAKIKSGDKVFSYQIALAEFEYAQKNTAETISILESLIKKESAPDNVLTAQVKLGELYYDEKKFEVAEKIVADILRKDSRNIGGLKLRAMIRMERAQLEPAIIDLRQALNDQPRATDLMMLLAVAYERSGSIDLAEKQYAEATRASNFNPVVGLNYVNFLQRRSGAARAEDILTELAARWPDNVQVLSALASAKLARRDYVGAEEVAASLRKLGSGSQSVADQILGASLAGRNKLDQSIEVLQSAHDQAPTSIQPIASLVRALIRAQKLDRALALLQDEQKKAPNSANILVMLGSAQLLNNEPQEAGNNFKLAIEKEPKSPVGYQAMANFLIQQKRLPAAIEVVQSGLKELPESFALRLLLAGAHELAQNYDAAIAEYEKLLKDEPGSLVAANNLASLLTEHRTDKESFNRAYTLIAGLQKSQVPFFKDTIGWVYYRRGEFRAAVAQLEQASSELPNLATVRYHLGESYLAVGQNDKAATELNQALNLAADDQRLQEAVRSAMKRAGLH